MRISDWSSDVCSSDLVADGREARLQRFLGVPQRFIGRHLLALGEARDQPLLPGAVRREVDVAVDEAWKNEPVRQVDQGGAGGRLGEAVLDRDDAAVANDEGRVAAGFLTRPVEQGAGVDEDLASRRGRLGGSSGGEGGGPTSGEGEARAEEHRTE